MQNDESFGARMQDQQNQQSVENHNRQYLMNNWNQNASQPYQALRDRSNSPKHPQYQVRSDEKKQADRLTTD